MAQTQARAWLRPKDAPETFFSVDLRALALFRIGLGLIVSGDALDRCRSLMLLTDEGPSPRALLESLGGWPSLHGFSGGTGVTSALLAAQALVGLALAAGVVTRVAAVCSFLLVASVQHRAPWGRSRATTCCERCCFGVCFFPWAPASPSTPEATDDRDCTSRPPRWLWCCNPS